MPLFLTLTLTLTLTLIGGYLAEKCDYSAVWIGLNDMSAEGIWRCLPGIFLITYHNPTRSTLTETLTLTSNVSLGAGELTGRTKPHPASTGHTGPRINLPSRGPLLG